MAAESGLQDLSGPYDQRRKRNVHAIESDCIGATLGIGGGGKRKTLKRLFFQHNRVLLHWNGHGIPRPTKVGETWAFSQVSLFSSIFQKLKFRQDFTQYVPISVVDLVRWVGSPSLIIFDCESAGALLDCFKKHVDLKHKQVVVSCFSASIALATRIALFSVLVPLEKHFHSTLHALQIF